MPQCYIHANLVLIHSQFHEITLHMRKCHSNAKTNSNADNDGNQTKNNMSPSPLFGGHNTLLLIDFSLTVKAATLIFISGRGLAISSAKQGILGSIYNLIKS